MQASVTQARKHQQHTNPTLAKTKHQTRKTHIFQDGESAALAPSSRPWIRPCASPAPGATPSTLAFNLPMPILATSFMHQRGGVEAIGEPEIHKSVIIQHHDLIHCLIYPGLSCLSVEEAVDEFSSQNKEKIQESAQPNNVSTCRGGGSEMGRQEVMAQASDARTYVRFSWNGMSKSTKC